MLEMPQQVLEGDLESARERIVDSDSGVFGTNGMMGDCFFLNVFSGRTTQPWEAVEDM